MKTDDKKALKRAYKLLAKYGGYPHANCKEHAMNCFQCQMKRFMEDFYSLITFYMEIDFDPTPNTRKRVKKNL